MRSRQLSNEETRSQEGFRQSDVPVTRSLTAGTYFVAAHWDGSVGNRAPCFTPLRGSAIQSATASRQAA